MNLPSGLKETTYRSSDFICPSCGIGYEDISDCNGDLHWEFDCACGKTVNVDREEVVKFKYQPSVKF
jgi:lysyl-tRNA synthetase class I